MEPRAKLMVCTGGQDPGRTTTVEELLYSTVSVVLVGVGWLRAQDLTVGIPTCILNAINAMCHLGWLRSYSGYLRYRTVLVRIPIYRRDLRASSVWCPMCD